MVRTALGLMLVALTGGAAEVSVETFTAAPTGPEWGLHQEGSGRVGVEGGALVLDLSAAETGKHAWAEFSPWLKLPMTLEWRQMTRRDSPHFYHAGVYLQDLKGGNATFGLSGEPLGQRVHASGKAGERAHPSGEWHCFRLEVAADRAAVLTVRTCAETLVEGGGAKQAQDGNGAAPTAARPPADNGGEERFEVRLTGLQGRLLRAGFFHNQPRHQGPDAYAQDRGSSAIAGVRIEAAAFYRGDPAAYRDQDVRCMDPREPITFNRAMAWIALPAGAGGGTLAYDAAPQLLLTGSGQVTGWQVNRGCGMVDVDPATSQFRRPNDLDGADSAAIPMLQWCLKQHPYLDYELIPAGGAVRLSVVLPCAYLGRGIALFQTGSSTAPQRGRLDLAGLLAGFGLGDRVYGEIGVILDQERGPAGGDSTCQARLALSGPGALITGPAVVRTPQPAAEGIAVAVLVAGPDGGLLRGDSIAVTGRLGTSTVAFADPGGAGVYTAEVTGLTAGTHRLELVAANATLSYTGSLEICVSALPTARWSPERPTYGTDSGGGLPTLLGDLLAWVPLLNAGLPGRRVIATAAQWQALTPEEQKAVALVKLRTLTRAQIGAMLDGYAAAGVRVIRLTPNVSPRESILDAGGQAAPHGLETLAWTLAECRARGIRAVINLFHYPYGSAGTGSYPPWRQYLDAGYSGEGSFFSPTVGIRLRGYLADVLAVTRDDPAVLAYSLTGENDQAYPVEWVNDLYAFVREHDPNHLVTLEQGGGILQRAGGVPWSYAEFAPAKSAGVGYRTYYTGGLETDVYMMICGRAYRSDPPAFMAEEASGPGWYGGFYRDWLHPDFLTKIRDAHWMAVLCQHTMSLCWSAPWSQTECRVPQRCLEQIDWGRFRRALPPLAVAVRAITPDTIPALAVIERRLADLALDYDYVWPAAPERLTQPTYRVVLDPAAPAAVDALPAEVLQSRPLGPLAGRGVSYLLSAAPYQALALVRNTAEHRLGPGYGDGVQENHRQHRRAGPVAITFANVPAGASFKIYDLDEARCVRQGTTRAGLAVDLGVTAHDLAVLISELPLPEGW
jgi:hypothetical protein